MKEARRGLAAPFPDAGKFDRSTREGVAMFQSTAGLGPIAVLVAALCVAAFKEAKNGDYPNSFPIILSLWFAARALADQGPGGAVLAAAGFAGGACMLAAPAILGRVRGRHALLFGMIGSALGLEALFTVFLFTCLAWILCQALARLERGILRKRLFRNIYGSSRFVLAGLGDVDLFTDDKPSILTMGYGPIISIGAISAMLWRMSGYQYLVMV